MDGTAVQIVTATIFGLVSVFCIAAAVIGYVLHPLGAIGRITMAATGLLLMYKSSATNIAGLVMLPAMFALMRRRRIPQNP